MEGVRKRVRRARAAPDPPPTAVSGAAGQFEPLPDDALVQILETLAALDPDCEGSEWQLNRRRCSRDALRLAATCKRLRAALLLNYWPKLGPLRVELLARATTDVQPGARTRAGPRPYLTQFDLEQHSATQLRALDALDGQMGFHCSGNCCEHARLSANRKLEKQQLRVRVHALKKPYLREVSPARDKPGVAFGYEHDRQLVRITADDAESRVVCDSELGPRHKPLLLRASPNGAHVAWVTYDAEDQTDVELHVWTPSVPGVVHEINASNIAHRANCQHWHGRPTGVWWTSDNRLCVAWSHTYVTPMGQDHAGGDTPDRYDIYLLATYDIDAHTGDWSLGEVWGKSDRFQRLISVSADESGTRVACLVRNAPVSGLGAANRAHYKVVVHAADMQADLQHPQVWKGAGSEGGTRPLDWGPSAVGVSPTADRIVVVHRTLGSVITEVFALDEGVRYARVNAHNLTEWTTLRPDCPYTGANAVKLRYAVGFSGCGRFATVTDQRARWKYDFTGYGLVCLDLARCRASRDMPVRALCYSEGFDIDGGLTGHHTVLATPVRELHWGGDSMWALAGKGVLRFSSSHAC